MTALIKHKTSPSRGHDLYNKPLAFFAVLVHVAVVVTYAPYHWSKEKNSLTHPVFSFDVRTTL